MINDKEAKKSGALWSAIILNLDHHVIQAQTFQKEEIQNGLGALGQNA
jgi:hypothetical protein